jgi:hypothetical protein
MIILKKNTFTLQYVWDKSLVKNKPKGLVDIRCEQTEVSCHMSFHKI